MFYFGLLMLLQRIIGQQRAIGGQVSWKSIIFKKVEVSDEFKFVGKKRKKVIIGNPTLRNLCDYSNYYFRFIAFTFFL